MKKLVTSILCLNLLFGCLPRVFALESDDIDGLLSETAEYICSAVPSPTVGSVGGEWAVIGLARSGCDIPKEYFQGYCENVEKYLKGNGGVLHERKYTEYSRVILALTAVGANPSDIAGFNLLTALADFNKTVFQGANGAAWALLALDSVGYEIPENTFAKVQATREMYVNRLLEYRLSDGGWALSQNAESSDADITAMVLQALSKYRGSDSVESAIDKALLCMSEKQNESAGFSGFGSENSESCIQMLVALCELGIPYNDDRFVKNGNSMLDALLAFKADGGGFCHNIGGNADLMATEQALYCLAAVKRQLEGKNSLYNMSDVSDIIALPTADENVKDDEQITEITFSDIAQHESRTAIEALAARKILNGKAENYFDPSGSVTRAEFAAITVRALKLPESGVTVFSDVTESDWFFGYVGAAYENNITAGVSDTQFNPSGTITREQAAVMIARAASLCGLDTEKTDFEARNILAGFIDYTMASDWASGSLAFCYGSGISDDSDLEIKPQQAVTRAEIAQMMFNMLTLANLI